MVDARSVCPIQAKVCRGLFQTIPLGRVGKPEEYAALAMHLASDQNYWVGQIINPNGGLVI